MGGVLYSWFLFGPGAGSREAEVPATVQTTVQLIGAVPYGQGHVYRIDDEARGNTCYAAWSTKNVTITCLKEGSP